jgi:hypothetical protein
LQFFFVIGFCSVSILGNFAWHSTNWLFIFFARQGVRAQSLHGFATDFAD